MKKKELIKKLKEAVWVCSDCGEKYGEYKGGVVGVHLDICDICGEEKSVCQPRDYKYFRKFLSHK